MIRWCERHTRGLLSWAIGATVLLAVCGPAWSADATTQPQSDPAAAPTTAPISGPMVVGPPTTPVTKDDSGNAIRVKSNRPGAFDIDCQDTDIRSIFRLLSTVGNKNIITTKDVTGKVTVVLYDVTFPEALDAVLRSSGFVCVEKGNLIHVMNQKQKDDLEKSERQLKVQTFKLFYLTAADAKLLIAPAMSTEGKVVTTPVDESGIDDNKTKAGGNSHSTDDFLVVSDYEDRLKRVGEILAELDIKPEQVLIEATILKCSLTEENQLGINFNVLSGVKFDGKGVSNINTAFTTPSGGITVGFTSGDVTATIAALETVADTTILANPKLLVVNKQRGSVLVGRSDGYLATTTQTDTAQTATVQFLDTGTKLLVRPYIGKDGYIRMEIHPEESSGVVQVIGTNALPHKDTTEVTSNVLVRDGHTIVIGGLFREETLNSKSQVPGLGSIPVVGALFRANDDSIKRGEMIILLTPHIIRQAKDEAVSEQIKDDTDRFMIGQRKGMYWFSHDRLTQTYMHEAKEALNAGKHDLALWNVDMALSLSPRLEEAIHLRERLTGKAYWSDEPHTSSVQFTIQRMIMQDMGKPVESVIPPGKPLDVDAIDPDTRKEFGIEKRVEAPLPTFKTHRRTTIRPATTGPSGDFVEDTISGPQGED